jgi:hypothetical protein
MAILSEAPAGSRVYDLGAARMAREEVRVAAGGALPLLKLAVGFVEVRPEVALAVGIDFQAEKIREGLAGLLADPADVDTLLADGLTKEDLQAIVQFMAGLELGESSASPSL